MEKIMTRNGACAAIIDTGVGVEISYLGYHHQFPEVVQSKPNYPALIPGWKPAPTRKELARLGKC